MSLSYKVFSKISDQCRRVQPTVGGAIPGMIFLGAIRKQAKQARRKKLSKQHSSMTSAPALISSFLL